MTKQFQPDDIFEGSLLLLFFSSVSSFFCRCDLRNRFVLTVIWISQSNKSLVWQSNSLKIVILHQFELSLPMPVYSFQNLLLIWFFDEFCKGYDAVQSVIWWNKEQITDETEWCHLAFCPFFLSIGFSKLISLEWWATISQAFALVKCKELLLVQTLATSLPMARRNNVGSWLNWFGFLLVGECLMLSLYFDIVVDDLVKTQMNLTREIVPSWLWYESLRGTNHKNDKTISAWLYFWRLLCVAFFQSEGTAPWDLSIGSFFCRWDLRNQFVMTVIWIGKSNKSLIWQSDSLKINSICRCLWFSFQSFYSRFSLEDQVFCRILQGLWHCPICDMME